MCTHSTWYLKCWYEIRSLFYIALWWQINYCCKFILIFNPLLYAIIQFTNVTSFLMAAIAVGNIYNLSAQQFSMLLPPKILRKCHEDIPYVFIMMEYSMLWLSSMYSVSFLYHITCYYGLEFEMLYFVYDGGKVYSIMYWPRKVYIQLFCHCFVLVMGRVWISNLIKPFHIHINSILSVKSLDFSKCRIIVLSF